SGSFFYDLNADFISAYKTYREFIHRNLFNLKNDVEQSFENADKIYRFNTINYLMAKYVKSPAQLSRKKISSKIDAVTTHKIFGYAILLAVLFLVFQFIFYVSETPMSWIEQGFLQFGNFVSE